jgi:hypothetical protein
MSTIRNLKQRDKKKHTTGDDSFQLITLSSTCSQSSRLEDILVVVAATRRVTDAKLVFANRDNCEGASPPSKKSIHFCHSSPDSKSTIVPIVLLNSLSAHI